MAAFGGSPAALLQVQEPSLEPRTLVLILSGSITRADISELGRDARNFISACDAEDIVCDVSALAAADAGAVDALARLQLTARRLGRTLRFTGVREELRALVVFMGLAEILSIPRDDFRELPRS